MKDETPLAYERQHGRQHLDIHLNSGSPNLDRLLTI